MRRSLYFGCSTGFAAEDSHFHVRVEKDEIDRDLQRAKRFVVLCVQVARVAHVHVADFAVDLDARAPEIDGAFVDELVEPAPCLRRRLEHARHEMCAALGVAQHLRDEDPLLDLAAVLVRLHPLGFFRDFGLGWDEPGPQLGGAPDELVDAHRARLASLR